MPKSNSPKSPTNPKGAGRPKGSGKQPTRSKAKAKSAVAHEGGRREAAATSATPAKTKSLPTLAEARQAYIEAVYREFGKGRDEESCTRRGEEMALIFKAIPIITTDIAVGREILDRGVIKMTIKGKIG
jgi:hypothetical protein